MVSSVLAVAVAPAVDRYTWFDSLRLGTVNRPHRVEVRAGGKAFNSSRVMSEIGLGVVAVVPAHRSEQGWFRAEGEAAGIEVRTVVVPQRTRSTVTCLDDRTGDSTEIYEPSEQLDTASWHRIGDTVAELLGGGSGAPVDAVVIGGTRPGSSDGVLVDIVSAAHRAGAVVFVDACGAETRSILAAGPEVIKVNMAEAAGLIGPDERDDEDRPPAVAARELCRLGARAAVVTAGQSGATFFAAKHDFAVEGPQRPGAYPGGSGDAFLAGLVESTLAGSSPERAMANAAWCAEENAAHPHAGHVDMDRWHTWKRSQG